MKVRMSTPGSQALLFVDSLNIEDGDATLTYPDGSTETVDAGVVTIEAEAFTRGDWDAAFVGLTCPCGDEADYLCSCGCPCCGEDPCERGCGGAVRPLHEAQDKFIVPDEKYL